MVQRELGWSQDSLQPTANSSQPAAGRLQTTAQAVAPRGLFYRECVGLQARRKRRATVCQWRVAAAGYSGRLSSASVW
jgi:hypothetical protein